MAAYFIYARLDVIDEDKSNQFSKLAVRQIGRFGGEVVTARGKTDVREGEWQPKLVTILKFESKEALLIWYESAEYAPLKQMRLESNVGDFVIVEEA
jgi:uncharacterized protein (DUF1330 family)